MRRIVYTAILLLLSVLLLSACGTASFEKESSNAKTAAKTAFGEKKKGANHKSKEIDFYLPSGFKVEKETPNNIILKNGDKTYILFFNPHEGRKSKVVYDASVAQYEEPEINEEFNGKGQVGFLLIEKLEDDMNVVTAGVGGAKVTTETKTGNLEEDAVTMMQIANSVKLKK